MKVIIDVEVTPRTRRAIGWLVLPLAMFAGTVTVAHAGWKEDPAGWIHGGKPILADKLLTLFQEADQRLVALEAAAPPPGTIVAYGGSVPPSGWLLCDGTALKSTDYPALSFALKTAWGDGTKGKSGGTPENVGADFNLPDLRGRFLRGWDNGANHDPEAVIRLISATGGAVGDHVGSLQSDDFKKHSHGVNAPVVYGAVNGKFGWGDANDSGTTYTFDSNTAGGTETRPVNVSVNFIIKS